MEGDLGRSVTHVFHLAFSGELSPTGIKSPTCNAQAGTHHRSRKDDLQEEHHGPCVRGHCERIASFHAGDMSNVGQTTFLWMKNVVEILEELGAPLEHVFFSQGFVSAAPLCTRWQWRPYPFLPAHV